MTIPEAIQRHTDGKKFICDDIGKSDSSIYIYDDMVLKADRNIQNAEICIKVTEWLDGRLPVPEIIEHEVHDGISYLLMTRIKGQMACDPYFMERPQELYGHLAESIRKLWSIDISDCPVDRNIGAELREAEYRVENGLVNMSLCEPETFGKGGFRDPQDLLKWLEDNKPESDPVLSHGDLCLPNIFVNYNKISGLIDTGDMGTADRWRDLSLCYRSLKHNADGTFGMRYEGIEPNMLFYELGITPDREKLRYYLLLDELF